MATTYTWIVENCEYEPATGGVVTVHWRCNGTNTGETTTAYGSVSFDYDPEDPNFVEFNALTEETVLGWVWANGVDQQGIEDLVDRRIQDKLNPTVVSGTPWA